MAETHEPQQPSRESAGEGVPSTGATDEDELRAARVANRFDIRRIIGALFILYGVVLTVTGIVGSEEVKNKAVGINVNLWTGLGMLVFGVLMVVWALARPVAPEPSETPGRGSGRIRRSTAT
jgi:NADH:ubiquinone oxidoreductase subunit 6 (subunit J)